MFRTITNNAMVIRYNVPYYPQKDTMSCWYYAMKMILDAFGVEQRRAVKSSLTEAERDLLGRFQARGLPNTDAPDAEQLVAKFRFIYTQLAISKTADDRIIARTFFELLKIRGPIINRGRGHEFPIVGVDLNDGTLIIHYILPLVYTRLPNGQIVPNERFFWGTGRNPISSRSRGVILTRTGAVGILKNWVDNPVNFQTLQYAPNFQRYANPGLAQEIKGRIHVSEEEIRQYVLRTEGIDITAEGGFFPPAARDITIDAITYFKTAAHLYPETAFRAAQNLKIPVRLFLREFSEDLRDSFDLLYAFYNPST